MNVNPGMGTVLAILGGVLMGSFSLPMKKTTRWAWETTWLVWAVAALILTPWAIAFRTVPDLCGVISRSGVGTLGMVFLFGIGWGLGAVTFGRSISILGMSLAFALSIGLTLALGSFVPMAMKPGGFKSAGVTVVVLGILLMLAGVMVCALAGRRKEAQLQQASGAGPSIRAAGSTFIKGMTLCILSGMFNPMINFAFSFGEGIKASARAAGASDGGASDAVWAVTLLGGFVSNCVYCIVLLNRNKTWSHYRLSGTSSYWFLAALMGVTWLLSVTIYGRASAMMGKLGDSAGWAIVMGCCIMASNVWGILTGEWREGKGKPLRTMYVGLAVILLAIIVIGYGNSLSG